MVQSLLFALVLSAISYAQPDTAWLFTAHDTTRGSEPLAFFADDTGKAAVRCQLCAAGGDGLPAALVALCQRRGLGEQPDTDG